MSTIPRTEKYGTEKYSPIFLSHIFLSALLGVAETMINGHQPFIETCPYRKSRPTFRCLHLPDLFLDTTHRLCESRFRDPTSRLWLSSLFSFRLHALFLRLDFN